MPYALLRHAESRSLRMYYEVHGRGEPLLLIRGFTRSLRFWGPFLEEMARGWRVIVFDNRGVGRSDAPLGPYTIRQMAGDARALLDHLQIERAQVFGVSMGGMIAQELALLHRERVGRLVLGATTPGGRHAARVPPEQIWRAARAMTLPPREAVSMSAQMTLSAGFLASHPEIVDTWAALLAQDPQRRRGFLGQAAAVLRHDTWDRLPHLRAPTLVLVGDQDALVPPANAELLAARIPEARLRVLKGVGHDLTTEAAQKCQLLVSDFLERG
jgi:3-oxoadipate enol-lactonase